MRRALGFERGTREVSKALNMVQQKALSRKYLSLVVVDLLFVSVAIAESVITHTYTGTQAYTQTPTHPHTPTH